MTPGVLRVLTRDGDTVAADDLAATLADLADALEALGRVPLEDRRAVLDGLYAVERSASEVIDLASAYGVVAALPVIDAGDVLTKAHREATGDGLTATTAAELADLARGRA